MSFIKCPRCKCMRDIEDFEIYKGIRRKSCLKCKANNAKYKTNEPNKPNEPNEPNEPNDDPSRYIRHQRLYKKLNNEFLERAGKSVHIYNMRHILVDIRDCLIHSDKEFSHTNY